MSWTAERSRFPVLERFAYLNAGTFGPLARSVLAAMSDLRAWEAVHGRGGRSYFDAMRERRERVRVLVAAQLGVPPENVALTESTTRGVHIVVTGLGLGPGDDVVTTDSEHFGLIGPLAASGAALRIARVHGIPGAELVDRIRAEVTPRTRLIALSAVSWIDGTILPWREVRRETGVPVLVDGAQSVGALDVDASAADYYTVSAQKWLCGPDATGALYVADPEALPPRLVSNAGAGSTDLAAGTWEPEAGARRHDQPYTPASSLAGLEEALTGLPAGRFDRAADLTRLCRALLREHGHDVVGEDGQGTLVAFRMPGDPAAAAAALYERGVVLRELPGTGLLRASVGWWNDEGDIDRLLAGLRGL